MQRAFWRIGNAVFPSLSESIYRTTAKLLSYWIIIGVVGGAFGFSHFAALWFVMPIAVIFVIITKLALPAVGVAGLADDVGIIDLPPIFDPVRVAASVASVFGDFGFVIQIASGTAEITAIGFQRGLSFVLTGLKLLMNRMRR